MYDMLIGDIIPAGIYVYTWYLVPGIYGPYILVYNICLDICVLPGSYIDEHAISPPTTLADRNATIPTIEEKREGIYIVAVPLKKIALRVRVHNIRY